MQKNKQASAPHHSPGRRAVCDLVNRLFKAQACPAPEYESFATMTWDYSHLSPPSDSGEIPKREFLPLEKLGWKPFFSEQTSADDLAEAVPVRVVEVHRKGLHVVGESFDAFIPPGPDAAAGDWFLYDQHDPSRSKILQRSSLFERRAAGTEHKRQLITANVDTVFIVSSCNKEFNVARLERYLVLAFEAEVTPVILLTKADLCDDPAPYVEAASAISNRVVVELLNALSHEPIAKLSRWCGLGQTVAFLGSSGVGKSTLVNALFKDDVADTAAIRENDNKGRHTTTRRQLRFTPEGCAVLDTPGMRELQLTNVKAGIADLFSDMADLVSQCRFNDCQHDSEPGCAIQNAIELGEIDPSRFARWNKLVLEERSNSSSMAARGTDNRSQLKRTKKTKQ